MEMIDGPETRKYGKPVVCVCGNPASMVHGAALQRKRVALRFVTD